MKTTTERIKQAIRTDSFVGVVWCCVFRTLALVTIQTPHSHWMGDCCVARALFFLLLLSFLLCFFFLFLIFLGQLWSVKFTRITTTPDSPETQTCYVTSARTTKDCYLYQTVFSLFFTFFF